MTLLLARLAQILLSVVSIKLSSHLLAPEQMGRFALANSVVAFFSFMFFNPVGMFMNRRMHSWWRDGQWPSYHLWFGAYVLGVAAIAGLSFVFAAPLYSGLDMALGWMLLLICGSVIVTTANQLLISSLNLLGFVRPFAVLTVLTPLLGLGVAWVLCDWQHPQTEYWLSGLLIGQAVAVAFALAVYRGAWQARGGPTVIVRALQPQMLQRLFVYAWPISIAVVLGWLQNQGYRLVMENQIGLKQLGIFVAAYGIALGIMSAVESLLASLLQPAFYRRLNEPGSLAAAAWNDYAAIALPVLVLTAATLAAAAPEAVHIFLAPAYWDTAEYVRWAAVIELVRTAANVYGLAMHAEMNTRRLILPSLLGAVLSTGFLTLSARAWGLAGVGPALACAGLLYLLSYHVAARRLSGVSLPYRRTLLALGGGLLALVLVSAARSWSFSSSVMATTALRATPAALVYFAFAAMLVRPVTSSSSPTATRA